MGMKLLPTGRKSVFYVTIYGSVLGAGSFLLHYFSMLVNFVLVNFGLSEDMYNPVEYLPVIAPLDNKIDNAAHFAERENPSLYLVEMAWVKNAFNISTSEAEEFLDKFLSMSPDSSGCVKLDGFVRILRLGLSPLSKKVGLLNVDGYYKSLLSIIDKAVEEGFISPSARHIIGWDFLSFFFFYRNEMDECCLDEDVRGEYV